jgi:hypothetical protein
MKGIMKYRTAKIIITIVGILFFALFVDSIVALLNLDFPNELSRC